MRKTILALSFFFLMSLAGAQLTGTCSQLFGGPMPLYAPGFFGGVISVSFLIVLLVLSLLGIVYAIGTALDIDALKKFVKSEFLQSLANVAILGAIGAGLAFSSGLILFISNIAALGGQVIGVSPPVSGNAQTIYMSLCTTYLEYNVDSLISPTGYIVETYSQQVILSAFQSLNIDLEPNRFGFEVQPFAGLEPVIGVIGEQLGIFMAIVGVFIGISLFLFLIYSLFPIFLYAGILLRSFPWTRAAGGSLIVLFIAFYIVFPAILYPFSVYTAGSFMPISGLSLVDVFSFSLSAVIPLSYLFANPLTGNPVLNEIRSFSGAISGLAVLLLGIVISVAVSFDVVEILGDLLGAPSLQAKKMLENVI